MSTDSSIDATVVILTKNEERHIARAVESAKRFKKILVVDSFSDDMTVKIAEKAGAQVIQFGWNGQYPKKKEWALQHVETDWVFYLDADEYFGIDLTTQISRLILEDDVSAIEVPLKYFWEGKELKYGHRVNKRIGMRLSTCFWPRPNDLSVKNMWEVEGHYQPQVKRGRIAKVPEAMGHQDEDGLYDYFARHNRYSDWEAHMLQQREEISHRSRSRLGKMAVKLPAKPLVFFVYSFILRLGFVDGRAGFNYAIALSFYYWQIGLKVRELDSQR